MKKLFILALSLLVLVGCYSADQKRSIKIGKVKKDVEIRIIASGSQQNESGLAADLAGSAPVEGIPVNLKALIESQGVGQTVSTDIEEVGGTLKIDIIGTGIQNGRSIEVKTQKEQVLIGELESQLKD